MLCGLCFYPKASLNHHILMSKGLIPSYKSTHSSIGLGKVTGAAGSWPSHPLWMLYDLELPPSLDLHILLCKRLSPSYRSIHSNVCWEKSGRRPFLPRAGSLPGSLHSWTHTKVSTPISCPFRALPYANYSWATPHRVGVDMG